MRILSTTILLLCSFLLFAQKAEQAVEKNFQQYPQEKVILLFSKNEYIAGEHVYFKAHVLSGYQPSEISTNLYAELYDKNKKLLDKKIIPLLGGSGDGSFTLPASMAEDVYYVRAYTQWMLNFSERFQYLRPLPIYNPYSMNSLRAKPLRWTAKAMPEGGQLIAGEVTKIAIRLSSEGVLPSSWSGRLVEKETGRFITDVTVYNSEIGQVQFLPESHKAYSVQLKDAAGNSGELELPRATESGIAMKISVSDKRLDYAILFKGVANNGKGYKLIGTMHSELLFKAQIQRSDGSITGFINIDSFPAGVLRLTLFDENEKPVAERLCFLHQRSLKLWEPALQTDTLSFASKGRNVWKLDIDTLNWISYSVQVMDASHAQESDFLGAVYLSSDFLSPIYQASWYLQNITPQKQAALDALLISEVWDRFYWSNVLQNRFPPIEFKADAYLTYSGTVYGGRKLKPLREVNLFLQLKDSSLQFVQVKTDSSATFTLSNLVFVDTAKVFYQPNKRKFMETDVKIDFVLENHFQPLKRELPSSPWIIATRNEKDSLPVSVKKAIAQKTQELLLVERSRMMEEVIVRTKARTATEELDRKLSSGLFYSPDAVVFDFINQNQTSAAGYYNILDWLQGRIAGYRTVNNNGVLVPFLRNEAVQVFLDEMPVDAAALVGISVNDIAMIKIFRSNFGASSSSNGGIAVYTRRGGMHSKSAVSSLLTSNIVGYDPLPPFFLPDYSAGITASIADERTILYRNTTPFPTEEKGRFSFYFHNNDHAKIFRVLVTGFTKEGIPVFLDRMVSR